MRDKAAFNTLPGVEPRSPEQPAPSETLFDTAKWLIPLIALFGLLWWVFNDFSIAESEGFDPARLKLAIDFTSTPGMNCCWSVCSRDPLRT